MKKTHHSSLSKGEVSAAPAAFVIALNCYQGDRYWHYRAAHQSIKRIRHHFFANNLRQYTPICRGVGGRRRARSGRRMDNLPHRPWWCSHAQTGTLRRLNGAHLRASIPQTDHPGNEIGYMGWDDTVTPSPIPKMAGLPAIVVFCFRYFFARLRSFSVRYFCGCGWIWA